MVRTWTCLCLSYSFGLSDSELCFSNAVPAFMPLLLRDHSTAILEACHSALTYLGSYPIHARARLSAGIKRGLRARRSLIGSRDGRSSELATRGLRRHLIVPDQISLTSPQPHSFLFLSSSFSNPSKPLRHLLNPISSTRLSREADSEQIQQTWQS